MDFHELLLEIDFEKVSYQRIARGRDLSDWLMRRGAWILLPPVGLYFIARYIVGFNVPWFVDLFLLLSNAIGSIMFWVGLRLKWYWRFGYHRKAIGSVSDQLYREFPTIQPFWLKKKFFKRYNVDELKAAARILHQINQKLLVSCRKERSRKNRELLVIEHHQYLNREHGLLNSRLTFVAESFDPRSPEVREILQSLESASLSQKRSLLTSMLGVVRPQSNKIQTLVKRFTALRSEEVDAGAQKMFESAFSEQELSDKERRRRLVEAIDIQRRFLRKLGSRQATQPAVSERPKTVPAATGIVSSHESVESLINQYFSLNQIELAVDEMADAQVIQAVLGSLVEFGKSFAIIGPSMHRKPKTLRKGTKDHFRSRGWEFDAGTYVQTIRWLVRAGVLDEGYHNNGYALVNFVVRNSSAAEMLTGMVVSALASKVRKSVV